MAASVALQAKAAGTPAIRYEVLLWPVTDAAFDNGSYQQFQQGYFLSRNMMRWFWDSYTTDPAQRRAARSTPRHCRLAWSNLRACRRP
ncbi:alpha/beta hydrolase [Xanthomonas campestris]|uniref:alpha/beta hydrolase n=1 Tax=Xanthomonas campestris TaxID=339 RepID=UPI0021DA8F56|nr:alpha/beta hydrolase [Xanthomonas campestris]MEA9731416.1 alpha/beta hydrolase [Xanthomonas campestris]